MNNKGFTLIELIIVVAIIGVLAAISISYYSNYVQKSRQNACLYEAKYYANYVYYTVSIENSEKVFQKPNISSCDSITDASDWDEKTINMIIEAKSKNSTKVDIICNLNTGASCRVIS